MRADKGGVEGPVSPWVCPDVSLVSFSVVAAGEIWEADM